MMNAVRQEEPPVSMSSENTLGWALCFEVSLGLFALMIGSHLTEVWPAEHLEWPVGLMMIVWGIASALPLLFLMLGIRTVPWQPLADLTRFVDETLTPLFRGLHLGELALLSMAAGWGEELLFRGLIQAQISQSVNVLIGVLAASLLFALLHFITPAYLVMAFLISVYLGCLFWWFESLWVPILGHATYDFLILVYLRKTDRGE